MKVYYAFINMSQLDWLVYESWTQLWSDHKLNVILRILFVTEATQFCVTVGSTLLAHFDSFDSVKL